MVMEAATLSGPHRKCTAVPVQKSLSLPSYARAGGEGIDHRLIFAALEQKERVRRKSRIFAPRKEKCNRPSHLFCLPIPTSGAKCRETSLSSDTSCSSLEYKKSSPVLAKKETVLKSRKEDTPNSEKEDNIKSDKESTLKSAPKQETSTYETANTIKSESKTTANPSRTHQDAIDWETNRSQTKLGLNSLQKVSENRKGQRSPMDTLRLTVCSSDSMERSSRSSSDSLSRKERMIALKARVEAAREKYGNTSSSEEEAESRSAITRYNSDGVIHRSVRDVKTRSYLREKRLRRRSQDEFSIKKTQRKQNLSLSINPEGDGIRLDLEKTSKTQFSNNHLDIKTDFCSSPNFPDMLKKNYFSDFPSKENAMHFVQARIRHIEDEERKRRSGSDFLEKFGIQKMQNHENSSPVSMERSRPLEKPNEPPSTVSETKTNFDLAMRSSPIPRSAQAPTPPPRSPKSMTFINKALIQHQNSLILNQENSLERKKVFLSNVPALSYSQIFEKFDSKIDLVSGDAKFPVTGSPNDTSEKQKIKELFSSRRKTCGNFDFIDNNILDELCSIGNSVSSTTSNLVANKKFSSAMQIKKTDNKGYFSSTETPGLPSEDDARNKMWKSKWQENEQRKEYMFNSLESRKKPNPPSWVKWRTPPSKTETCLCHLFPDSKFSCSCKTKFESKQMHSSTSDTSKLEAFGLVNPKDVSSLPVKYSSRKLRSDTSTTNDDLTLKASKDQPLKSVHLTRESITNGESTLKNENSEKLSAAANLDSAMEELENVYRSLKMSSDNLSDRNSISNISLSDDDVKFPKPKNKDIFGINDSRFPRRSSVCETGLGSSKNFNYHKSTLCSPIKYVLPVSKDKNSEVNQCSIDELFNDLTQQLDLEQKLLKDPKDNRHHQPKFSLPANRFDSPKRSNKPSPQVSIHKEFYENLCKNRLDQSVKNHSPRICENNTSSSVEPPDKKRQKAVRSLSENISHLMSTANLDSNNKIPVDNNNVEKSTADQPSQKSYEPVLPDSTTNFVSKRDANFNQSSLSPKSEEKSLNLKRDEIRHIRVSMDTNVLQSNSVTSSNSFSDSKQYPSLSSAVSATQSVNKSETPKPCLPEQNFESKENLDVLDETGLEKLLNSLLGEVPERQSSLSQTKDLGPTTPPPIVPGKLQNVTANRITVLQKMDACIASKGKSKSPGAESYLKSLKSEEHAQKVTFRQNDNSLNQPSFIPVYTKKTDMCHNFTKNAAEDKNKSRQVESSEPVKTLNSLHSPPPRQKCLTDQIPGMAWNTHLRRRSVGFEDVASLSHNYGFNLANKRMQSEAVNCNIPAESALRPNNQLNSENDKNISYGKENGSETGFISTINQNSQVTENENNGFLQDTKLSQQLKDKSSKRKSSLNRMDFLDFSTANTGNAGQQKGSHQQKNNSSSDEGSDLPKSEFLSSKRKHISLSQSPSKDSSKQTNEVPLQSSSRGFKSGAHLLPRALQNNHVKSRHHRRVQSAATHLQKFSHSAGELESLTDLSEAAAPSNKICLSAQELDPSDCSGKYSKKTSSSVKKYPPGLLAKSALSNVEVSKNGNGNTSHCTVLSDAPENNSNLIEISSKVTSLTAKNNSDKEGSTVEQACKNGLVSEDRPVLSSLELNGTLNLKHIDSRSEDDAEVIESTVSMKNLDISSEVSFDNEIYISADDNCDYPESDTERRPSSILRKKVSEEKKELHGILKPSTDEKQSKTPPPSILKHRESSEEKDAWQQGDLHSILKKSTSEDESCNSGPDIRPILKVSTDDESPTCSMLRPRPILKKRTSFSEECSYASYPNGELKPILKKKSPLASDDQPRPILKSRRKSEDVRSTTSEFVPSRPRAYSADMGIKPNLETRFDSQESNKEDLGKPEEDNL